MGEETLESVKKEKNYGEKMKETDIARSRDSYKEF